MRRGVACVGGVIVGALLFGIGGVCVGWMWAHAGEPRVVVRHLTGATVPHVRIMTDVGESYTIEPIPPAESRRTQVSGRDEALWIVATTATGATHTSAQVYVTSQGTVFVVVSEDAVTIDDAF